MNETLLHRLAYLVAFWVRDAKMEPGRGSAVQIAAYLQAIFGQEQIEVDFATEKFLGTGLMAVEYAFSPTKEQMMQRFLAAHPGKISQQEDTNA